MKQLKATLSLVAVISLFVGAIWQGPASAATSPVISPLGRIFDYSVIKVPTAIDVDAAGNIYVSDVLKRQVVKFDKYLDVVKSYSLPLTGVSMAVTADGGRLIVGEKGQVKVYDTATGQALMSLGAGAGEFKYAGEIDIDPVARRIFVADVANYTVKAFDLDSGEFLFQFGGRGYANGQFVNIWSLSFNEHTGELYVADIASYRRYRPNVQVFSRDGRFLRALSGYRQFGSPSIPYFTGMTFDSQGRGYFLDTLNGSIRFMGLPTTPLGRYTNIGYRDGELAMPRDVVYDETTGRLFVSCDGGRVEVYGVDGAQNPENLNVEPGKPTPISPLGDVEVATVSPQLNYLNAEDVDGDELVYDVNVFSADAVVAEYVGLPSGETESYASVDVALTENERFGWSVRAFDGEDASEWTERQYFYVNATEEAPLAPTLVSPATESSVDGSTLFSWNASVDPDPFDSVSYRVEISADEAFSRIIISEDVIGAEAILGKMADYLELQDGETYYWHVLAIDNHGLVSAPGEANSFVYDTTILRFTANMPDAAVYLGGNYAYSGRFVGTTPVELRDLPVGSETVVVKRAGFEPDVGQVVIGERENIDYYAEMIPAIMPDGFKAQPLSADGEKVVLNGAAAPFIDDLNRDGVVDLVVGSADGAVSVFDGSVIDGELQFTSTGLFAAELPLVPGARPFLVDWNEDRVTDLLVGGSDGKVSLFIGGADGFTAVDFNTSGGAPVAVSGDAAPVVFDIDGDGDKDLLVGSSNGTIGQFLYDETTSQLVSAGILLFTDAPTTTSVVPFMTDWDANGTEDLLIAAREHLYVYSVTGGVWSPAGVLSVGDELLKNDKGHGRGAYSLGTELTVFVLDLDGKKGKDALVGNADGEIRRVRSFGKGYVTAFNPALKDKVAQISAADDNADTAELLKAIDTEDYNKAAKICRTLVRDVNAEAAIFSNELLDLLK